MECSFASQQYGSKSIVCIQHTAQASSSSSSCLLSFLRLNSCFSQNADNFHTRNKNGKKEKGKKKGKGRKKRKKKKINLGKNPWVHLCEEAGLWWMNAMVREIDGCVHGEQNSFGRARFLLTPSLIRATVLEYAFSGGRAMCIAFYSCSLPSLPFLPSIQRKMRYRSWGDTMW